MLRSRGVDRATLDEILVENPRRVLTFDEPRE
jgi:predicted metal-dependent phosphotriesterase family hydrolase